MKRYLILCGLALACVAGVPRDAAAGRSNPAWEIRIGSSGRGGPWYDARVSGRGGCGDSCGRDGWRRCDDRRDCDRCGRRDCGGYCGVRYDRVRSGRAWIPDRCHQASCGHGRNGRVRCDRAWAPGRWESGGHSSGCRR